MKKRMTIFTIALLAASPTFSQSLVDLANKEKERRQDVKDERFITDEQLARFRSERPTEPTPDALSVNPEGGERGEKFEKEKKGSEATGVDKTAKGDDEPVDFAGKPESYWRQTMGEARQKVQALENEANMLVLKLNELQTKFYSEDDGFKREGIQREIGKTFYEQDKNKEDFLKAKVALENLLKEARSAGALPGWIE